MHRPSGVPIDLQVARYWYWHRGAIINTIDNGKQVGKSSNIMLGTRRKLLPNPNHMYEYYT